MSHGNIMDEDLALLERIRDGDDTGLAELMERHKQAVFRFSVRYVQNEADAAEITEETFYRVYRYADRFKPKAKVSTWIFSITMNLCRDHFRRNKKRRTDLSLNVQADHEGGRELGSFVASTQVDPAQEALSAEALLSIETEIRELPDKLKLPFIFCVLEGHAYETYAEIIGVNRKTVETRIYRARKLLRQRLGDLHQKLFLSP